MFCIPSGNQTGQQKKPYLVGCLNPSEKYEFVSWDYDIPNGKVINIGNVIKFHGSKPPSSYLSNYVPINHYIYN